MTTEKEKLAEAKAAAKAKVGEKRTVTVDTIKFKKDSGSGIIFAVLQKAKKPLTMTEITERAVKAGLKNPARAKGVANWFAGNNVASKVDGKYTLLPSEVKEEGEAQAA